MKNIKTIFLKRLCCQLNVINSLRLRVITLKNSKNLYINSFIVMPMIFGSHFVHNKGKYIFGFKTIDLNKI